MTAPVVGDMHIGTLALLFACRGHNIILPGSGIKMAEQQKAWDLGPQSVL